MLLKVLFIILTILLGDGCATKPTPPQNTPMVDCWFGTNHYRMTRAQYYHQFLIIPDYEAGEPNAKLEVIGKLKQ